MTIQATIYLNSFNNTPDNWHAAYAASVERSLDDAGLVYDGHTGDVREWRQGDDEDTAVEAIAFYVRPPHEAPKGSVLGVWTQNGTTLNLRGADLEAALLDAYNAAQKVADDSTRVGLIAGDRVEAGLTVEDYDTGRVVEVDGDSVTVAWDSGVQTTQPSSHLRPEGTDAPPSDEQIKELEQEAAQAGDEAQVALCRSALDGNAKSRTACWGAIRAARAMG